MEVEWRRHRADELRQLAKEDAIVIVPVGSLEQHGPHLPVEIDSLLGETIALRTARLVAATEKVLGPALSLDGSVTPRRYKTIASRYWRKCASGGVVRPGTLARSSQRRRRTASSA
ncbi:MAG: creatininase family protein [Alphaproteobacteria bacterium]|nr:creatininase family protein [Alphaproteobacteria bacterium]